ncbi:MAG TPA: hypothetical protein EYQ14_04120 [Gammaproteobacteria bacterium]|nr:hypothetical protein [Gammaproteobacteria bacterium]HIL98026.1 hypothetical protein [Pseudomonadales bacterium]
MNTLSSPKVTSVMRFTYCKRVVGYLRLLRQHLSKQQAFMPTFVDVRCMLVLLAFFLPLQQAAAQKVGTLLHATSTKADGNDAFVFGFDRVFVSFKGSVNEHAAYKVMVDFNKYFNKWKQADGPAYPSDFIDKDGETATALKDAFITFSLPVSAINRFKLSVGKKKTAAGMEFNAPASKLEFVKRGLGQKLIFNRNVGLMLHASGLGERGIGFAAGVYNAGPSNASDIGIVGQDYTLVGQIEINPSKRLHVETYLGHAQTSVAEQKTVQLVGLGARFIPLPRLTIKGELMQRDDPNNAAVDGSNAYLQAAYQFSPRLQLAFKLDALDVSGNEKDRTDITLGLNAYVDSKNPHAAKVQINYVASDLSGKDAIQLLFQTVF